MSNFSGFLQLTDLNDFIKPSQECVQPVTIENVTDQVAKPKISVKSENYNTKTDDGKANLQKVKITLQDCLACSGCITSAEGVLISQQSHEEFLNFLNENQTRKAIQSNSDLVQIVVVTISQQPVLSLAQRYNLTIELTAAHLSGYLRNLGADYVLNTKISDDLALLECREQFIQRYRNNSKENPLPMLTSACPGWICYAEKTHGSFILPYVTTTRSPQQIMGVLVKQWLANKLQVTPNKIYHATIMPCYDKKLEASREDFFNEIANSKDVDCVITTIEIQQMLNNTPLSSYDCGKFDLPWYDDMANNETSDSINVWAHEKSTSGGYCEYIFKYAAKQLFQIELKSLEFRNIRNPDFREIILEKDGKCLLRFAIANGFRNIQNLVQKLKRGKDGFHFVEVMACPSGCINGGAQLRPQPEQSIRELNHELEQLYHQLPKSQPDNALTQFAFNNFFEGYHSEKARRLLHTKYHAVEKLNTALNIKW